jgi:Kef-type K+ transport system membrane component KefB
MNALIADVIGEVALVLVVSWLFGLAARRCGQPIVVGQILAGILLGPTLLGRLPGHLTSRLFPPAELQVLNVLAQIAVVLFMFGVGYELDRRSLQGRRRVAVLIAASALLVPMALGSGAVLLFRSEFASLGQSHISRPFVLFMGVAMAITALPVLAAIVRERGIAGSIPGVTATAAAGLMDVSAWLVLAAAIAGAQHKSGRSVLMTLLEFACFVLIMLLVVRPGLRWWMSRRRSVLSNQLPVALALALGSAWVTASLGLHPVFGGFLAGITMPTVDGSRDAEILRPMEEIGGLFLPLFFVVTGLSLNLISLGGTAFAILALVCAIAIVGKLGPAYAASRIGGLRRRDSAVVAVLINTRGLTELIALDLGLSAGLIDQRVFSILVLMALITTALTGPLLSLLPSPEVPPASSEQQPAALPQAGSSD